MVDGHGWSVVNHRRFFFHGSSCEFCSNMQQPIVFLDHHVWICLEEFSCTCQVQRAVWPPKKPQYFFGKIERLHWDQWVIGCPMKSKPKGPMDKWIPGTVMQCIHETSWTIQSGDRWQLSNLWETWDCVFTFERPSNESCICAESSRFCWNWQDQQKLRNSASRFRAFKSYLYLGKSARSTVPWNIYTYIYIYYNEHDVWIIFQNGGWFHVVLHIFI